jgi:hypothetical protein
MPYLRLPRLLPLLLPLPLLFCSATFPAAAGAGERRIALRAHAEVQGDTIFLASLFPPGAPDTFQKAAAAISLGPAPQSGSLRRFSRDAIGAAIEADGLPRSAFEVPEVITVRRASHVLSREEIFAAIETALTKGGTAESPAFRLEDLVYPSAIAVPSNDARLEVTQIRFDQALGRARFRLRTLAAPAALPFYVTARCPLRTSAKTLSGFKKFEALAPSSSLSAPGASVLVDPREPARMHLHSLDADMLLSVRPLERGHLGETIRVRLRPSGKTLQARVVGRNAVDAVF